MQQSTCPQRGKCTMVSAKKTNRMQTIATAKASNCGEWSRARLHAGSQVQPFLINFVLPTILEIQPVLSTDLPHKNIL